MHEVEIRNRDLLDTLGEFEYFYTNRDVVPLKQYTSYRERDERSRLTGPEYRDQIIKAGRSHSGFPEQMYALRLNSHEYANGSKKFKIPLDWMKRVSHLNENLMMHLGVRNNAAMQLYPPGGYISWHNNANAKGFNILFTWSETGDGSFNYMDGDREVVLQDKPGWVCRYGYFGSYDDDQLVYHTATTDCWRMTVAYIFDSNEIANGMQEELIEEIITP